MSDRPPTNAAIDWLRRNRGQPAPPPDTRLDEILATIRQLHKEIHRMSATQDTLAAEVADLKTGMAGLHAGVTDIQTRLAAAIAAGAGTTDPALLAELHGINDDLKGVVAGLAPADPPTPTAA